MGRSYLYYQDLAVIVLCTVVLAGDLVTSLYFAMDWEGARSLWHVLGFTSPSAGLFMAFLAFFHLRKIRRIALANRRSKRPIPICTREELIEGF